MDTNKNENKAIIKRSNNTVAGSGRLKRVEAPRERAKSAVSRKSGGQSTTALTRTDGARNTAIVKRTMIIESKKKNKKPLPVGTIFTIAVMTLLFIFLIMNYAEIDNYNSEIASLKDELTEMQKDADKLDQRLDKKNDLVSFEEYAADKLGMVKETELTKINITALPENTGEAFKYGDDERTGIGVLLSGFGEVIKDFFD